MPDINGDIQCKYVRSKPFDTCELYWMDVIFTYVEGFQTHLYTPTNSVAFFYCLFYIVPTNKISRVDH